MAKSLNEKPLTLKREIAALAKDREKLVKELSRCRRFLKKTFPGTTIQQRFGRLKTTGVLNIEQILMMYAELHFFIEGVGEGRSGNYRSGNSGYESCEATCTAAFRAQVFGDLDPDDPDYHVRIGLRGITRGLLGGSYVEYLGCLESCGFAHPPGRTTGGPSHPDPNPDPGPNS